MRPIELDVYFHTEETQSKKELGLPYNYIDCEVRRSLFFNIDAVTTEISDNGVENCIIHSGGDNFSVPYEYKELKGILQIHLSNES
jgi:hypothetical protein